MKPFTALTNPGKLRRLRELAKLALTHYDLDRPQIAFHCFETNLLFRVTTHSGEHFMLRLAYPGWRTLEDLQAEAIWLQAIHQDTDIRAPRILPTRSGEFVLPVSLPSIPSPWNVSLMTWAPGRLLGHYLNEHNLEKMGSLFARLHQYSAIWTPPAGFSTRRFEHWLSRGEPNRIVGKALSAEAAALPPASLNLLERMSQTVEAAYAAIDRADLRVIHCDLWHDNIKLHRGELIPFDFEDTVWGFRAHDIAMAMLDLLETAGEERYPALLAAFKRGYTALLDWPVDPIEILQIGRLLWMVNWVARNQAQHLSRMVERHITVFEHFEQTGQVTLPQE